MTLDYQAGPYWEMMFVFQNDFAYIFFTLAVIFGFVLAFAVGANDSANSWGTPIGAGTVSLRMAFLLGFIFETLGALFLSSGVISTIAGSGSVVRMEEYTGNVTEEWDKFVRDDPNFMSGDRKLMVGFISSMVASEVWQLIATYFSWPVSGTHSIISALIGFTLVEFQLAGVNAGNPNLFCGSGIFKVLYGLLVSPFLALVIGFCFYGFVYKGAIAGKKADSVTSKFFFSFCVFIMFWTIGFQMTTAKSFTAMEGYPVLISTQGCFDPNDKVFGMLVGITTGLLFSIPFHFFLLPRFLRSTKSFYLSFGKKSDDVRGLEMVKIQSCNDIKKIQTNTEEEPMEDYKVKNVFQPLQVLAACFAALNHGGNDVGNCIGPLVTIFSMYSNPIDWRQTMEQDSAYVWKLWGGIGIGLGLMMFGEKVIRTMGSKITPMTPSLGFVVVSSSNLVVMFCSLTGIPTSTTQCQVMALMGAGVARGWVDSGSFKQGLNTVNLGVFRNIGLSWLCTIPFSLALSSALYAVLRIIFIGGFYT